MDSFQYQYPVYNTALSTPSVATAVSAVAPLNGHLREGTSVVRRQNRSCDQCRKGKRKCDAVILRDGVALGPEEESKEAIKGQLLNGMCAAVITIVLGHDLPTPHPGLHNPPLTQY
jgi:hypothetical protein